MLNDKLRRLINDTGEELELDESVIEKDFYVTQVIHALSAVENEHFRLVFCGGTCLAKAHKVVSRMSEDIDFKIQFKNTNTNFSKTRFLKELKAFRSHIKEKIILPGLKTGELVPRNEGQYLRTEIDYPSVFPASTGLKPHILVEFTEADIRLAIDNLPIKTLIEETLTKVAIFNPISTHCVSVNETAIEKWVGLTRRVAAIERGRYSKDESLIRHVFDLNAIKQAGRITDDFFTLAKTIVANDAKQYKNQHPEYSANPGAEIKHSLALLKSNPSWKEHYQKFVEEMVYDSDLVVEYENALQVIEHISAKVIESIHQVNN